MYNGDCGTLPPPASDTEGVQTSSTLVRSVPLLPSITTPSLSTHAEDILSRSPPFQIYTS